MSGPQTSPAAPPATASPEARRHCLPRWLDALFLLAGFVSLAGLAIRLTIKDSTAPISALFYATPLPILTVGFGLLGWRWQRGRLIRSAFALMALGLAVWTSSVYWRSSTTVASGAPDTQRVRVLFWNTGRGSIGDDAAIAAEIRRAAADIVVLVEAVPWDEPDAIRRFWREACPELRPSVLGGGIVLLTRFPSGETLTADLPLDSITRQLDVDCDGHPLTLLICDIGSNPARSRGEVLSMVGETAGKLAERATLVLGDFNTPPDSLHFGPLRRAYRNGFETAGTGYLATWPMPLPVLALDQMWVSPSVTPLSCRHLWSLQSDHRPVLTELALP